MFGCADACVRFGYDLINGAVGSAAAKTCFNGLAQTVLLLARRQSLPAADFILRWGRRRRNRVVYYFCFAHSFTISGFSAAFPVGTDWK